MRIRSPRGERAQLATQLPGEQVAGATGIGALRSELSVSQVAVQSILQSLLQAHTFTLCAKS